MKTSRAIEYLIQTRKNTISLIDKHKAKVSVIPDGYSNSIIWNAAHNLVTLQLLAYKLSGLNINIPETFVDIYKKGTTASEENNIDIEELKTLLITTAKQLAIDYEKGIFKTYSPYETSYGITLNSIDEVISFNNTHEGLHLGYMMAMSKNL